MHVRSAFDAAACKHAESPVCGPCDQGDSSFACHVESRRVLLQSLGLLKGSPKRAHSTPPQACAHEVAQYQKWIEPGFRVTASGLCAANPQGPVSKDKPCSLCPSRHETPTGGSKTSRAKRRKNEKSSEGAQSATRYLVSASHSSYERNAQVAQPA